MYLTVFTLLSCHVMRTVIYVLCEIVSGMARSGRCDLGGSPPASDNPERPRLHPSLVFGPESISVGVGLPFVCSLRNVDPFVSVRRA